MAYLGSGAAPVATSTAANSVNTASVQNSAITSEKIADATIATSDIANNAVTIEKLNTTATQLFGSRNRIINGDMRIDQRNAGASQTITAAAALAYTVDRWYAYCTGANVTGQRVAGAGVDRYRYQFTGAASVTKIGFAQRIEVANCYDLNNTTATLSVDLANSVLTTVTWTAWYANTADTFGTLASPTRTQIATGTFTVNSTVARYSTQISIPSNATTGIEIEFSVGAQTSGTWTIGNVQLEVGSVATPFERRPYGTELALCQRYYFKIPYISNGGLLSGSAFADATTSFGAFGQFPVPMRTNPTALEQSGTAGDYKWNGVTAVTCSAVPTHSTRTTTLNWQVNNTVASGLTAGQGGSYITGASAGYLGWSAEL